MRLFSEPFKIGCPNFEITIHKGKSMTDTKELIEDRLRALQAERGTLALEVARLRDALQWYAEGPREPNVHYIVDAKSRTFISDFAHYGDKATIALSTTPSPSHSTELAQALIGLRNAVEDSADIYMTKAVTDALSRVRELENLK